MPQTPQPSTTTSPAHDAEATALVTRYLAHQSIMHSDEAVRRMAETALSVVVTGEHVRSLPVDEFSQLHVELAKVDADRAVAGLAPAARAWAAEQEARRAQ